MDNVYQMFNSIAPNNLKNSRYCIIGPSNSGKTTLAHCLIGYDLRKHRKITFLEGGKNILLDQLLPIYKKGNIEIERINLTENNIKEKINEIEKYIDEQINSKELLYQLFVIDDITHLMKESSKLQSFLNKMYTTSRQSGYDIISILHSIKLGNTIMRKNCTKIFITSNQPEFIDEFKNTIKDTNSIPIVIDCEKNPHEQVKLNMNIFNNINIQQFINRIGLINRESFPNVIRSNKRKNSEFIEINDPRFDDFQTRVPKNFFNNIKTGNRYSKLLRERAEIIKSEEKAVHPIENNDKVKESSNTNWDAYNNWGSDED